MKILPALALVVIAAHADSPPPAAPGQPELNVRLRVESREQTYTFDRSVPSPTDGTWLLTRVRIALKGTLSPGLTVYGQVQDARELGSDRPSTPYVLGREGDDALDLRQLYLERQLGGATLRAGRQTLAFGDERLVGPLDWNNFARSFDAVRVTLPTTGGAVDAFAASVVQVEPTAGGGWSSDHGSRDDLFAGLYVQRRLSSMLKLEPYWFWREKRTDTVYTAAGAGSARPYDIPQRVSTLGLRWSGGAADQSAGLDYDGEIAWQTGRVRGRQAAGAGFAYPGTAWLAHNAWALHLGVGRTTRAPGFPLHLYAEFNHATGDRNPGDQRDESFLNLFPTNHKFYGGLDAFAWKNMSELALTAAATLDPRTKLRLEHHGFALATTQDAWYRANAVTVVRPLTPAARAAARTMGQETDLVVTRRFGSRVTVDAGFSYFFAGRYLAQTGGASDARFAYVQTVLQW